MGIEDAQLPFVACGRTPSDPHHLRYFHDGLSAERSVMNSLVLYAAGITANCTQR
jgi:hypothetical protein